MDNEYKKASDIINKIFTDFNETSMQEANSFTRSWKELVGPDIAAHSKIIDVDKGVVIVEVDHPGWSQKIQFIKKQLLYNLSKNYPSPQIKNLSMRVVSECKTPYVKQTSTIGEGIPRVEEEETDVPVSETMNEDLKIMMERLKNSIKKGKPRN